MLNPGKHADLPVGDMAGEDNHPPTSRDRAINMLEAMRLDAPARFKDAYFSEVRVFSREATEIAPHAADEVRDLGLGKLGKARRMLRRACLETPRKGPMRRARPPPTAEAQSSGKSLNTPKKKAAPHASRRSASRGALTGTLGRVRVIAVADTTTGVKTSKLRGIGPTWQSSARCRVSRQAAPVACHNHSDSRQAR